MRADAGPADFSELARQVGDRLLRVQAPPAGLRNPYAIQDDPGAFQTTGWLGAYDSRASAVAVAAETAGDIAAAVRFAAATGTRLAIKGTGHDYLGRSGAPGSLLVWTHRMREVTVHDAFTPAGAAAGAPGVPAVTVGAGTRWLEAYQALAARGRYVQGGGCTSVGAAGGFTQGGGFGSFSRRYGTAAGNVLEAEVVTASGEVLIVNAGQHDDLFWALRGGGGGTFGVVTGLTMATHPMPQAISRVAGTIRARGAEDFRELVGELVRFLPRLCDDHWGEYVMVRTDDAVEFGLMAAELPVEQARAVWQPFLDWVAGHPDAFSSDVSVSALPFGLWDSRALDELAPGSVCHDDRPGAPAGQWWWAASQLEVSWYLNAYQSRWLPGRLLDEAPGAVAEALFRASRHSLVRLDVNKALRGEAPGAAARDRATAINPAVFDAAVLVLAASWQPETFPGVPGREPDPERGAAGARQVSRAMAEIRELAPGAGSYVNEADYFEPGWQQSFWGRNYPRLRRIKQKYDPANIFRVHHGVGSEA
ncbi:MAG TPA: FAD-binding protein [Streptosporangiaceae bacterium]